MNRLLSFLIILFLPILLLGQVGGTISTNQNMALSRATATDFVETFDLREDIKVERVFMFKNWIYGQIVKSDGELTEGDYLLNYDLLNKMLIVRIKGKNFAFPTHMLNGFILTDLLKSRKFEKLVVEDDISILESIVEGEYNLFRLDEVKIKDANYVAALDVGSTGQSSVIKEKFFIKVGDRIKEIPKKKKEAELLFKKYPGFKKYSVENKINFKKQEDLIKLFLFLNNSNN